MTEQLSVHPNTTVAKNDTPQHQNDWWQIQTPQKQMKTILAVCLLFGLNDAPIDTEGKNNPPSHNFSQT